MSNIENIKKEFEKNARNTAVFEYKLNDGLTLQIYPGSLHEFEDGILFIAKSGKNKFLYVAASDPETQYLMSSKANPQTAKMPG